MRKSKIHLNEHRAAPQYNILIHFIGWLYLDTFFIFLWRDPLESKDRRVSADRMLVLHKTDCQLLFKLHSRMLDVKSNFSNYYNEDMTCRTCRWPDSIENEQHLTKCENLKSKIKSYPDINFEDLFGDLKKQKETLFAYKSVLRKRDILLSTLDG